MVENIISLFEKDENKAFQILYKNYRKTFVDSMVNKNSGITETQAADLFQDSIIILYDNIMTKKVTHLKNPKSYLLRIGQLLAYQSFRNVEKERKLINELKSDFSDSSFDLENYSFLNPDSNGVKVERFLSELGGRCKELLVDFYYKNLTFEEIAQKYNYKNTNTVKSQKFKCIKKIREKSYGDGV